MRRLDTIISISYGSYVLVSNSLNMMIIFFDRSIDQIHRLDLDIFYLQTLIKTIFANVYKPMLHIYFIQHLSLSP